MPDFSSSIDNIQIQRGIGTSTNGASSFGASINIKTNGLKKKSYILTNNTVGSFSTLKNNLEFGTGLLNKRFSFDGRLSRISSSGYIDRATSNLKSLYIQGSYFYNKSVLKGIVFSGHEKTYQAWYGVPLDYLTNNRTFNNYTYDNEIDNYNQTHYQLHYTKQINNITNYNFSYHYTHGEGYYEQEKLEELLEDYNLNNIIISQDTITTTDLIRRKWLNNDFGGIVFSLNHKINSLELKIGGAVNHYSGQHYGNIIWSEYASNSDIDHQYYWDKAEKLDRNIYVKGDYQINESTNLFLDLQNRRITYSFRGFDEEQNISQQEINLDFFNPKFGIFHTLNDKQSMYASFSVGNKEPNRNDYVESTPTSRPIHETLYDSEIGYKKYGKRIILGINLYHMNYRNQLVLTGQINDVGAYTRTNIDKSFRQGIELEGIYKLNNKTTLNGNFTLSKNKITNFTEYIDNWDTWGQDSIMHENTDLAFSPNTIWSTMINYKLNKNISLNLISKYVGKQYIDNTSSTSRQLNDYLVNHLHISYKWKSNIFNVSKISLRVNNILDNEYVSNAWVYRFTSNSWDPRISNPYINKNNEGGYNEAGYFPQATRNFLLALTLGF